MLVGSIRLVEHDQLELADVAERVRVLRLQLDLVEEEPVGGEHAPALLLRECPRAERLDRERVERVRALCLPDGGGGVGRCVGAIQGAIGEPRARERVHHSRRRHEPDERGEGA